MTWKTWSRTGAAVLVGAVVALTATPAYAAPGDARAQALDIDLNATVTVPGIPPLTPALVVPVLNANVDLVQSAAPPGGQAAVVDLAAGLGAGLLGVAASDGTLTASSSSNQGGSTSASGVEDLALSVLGLPIRAGALSGTVSCPAGGTPTADTVVAGLSVFGTTVSATAGAVVSVPVSVAGLPAATLVATVTPSTETVSASAASATALTIALRLDVLGLTSVNAGSIVIGAATCESPAAVAPTATSLTPGSGPEEGGTSVTVTGSGFFQGLTSVTVGGTVVPADQVVVTSPTSLVFATPGGPAGPTTVSVTNTPGGTSTPGLPFTYLAVPGLTGIDPAVGPVAGGTTVTLTGDDFVTGATTVTIGTDTVPATVVSPTQLTFVTPGDPAGLVAVRVTTPDGVSGPLGFTYQAPDAPTLVTIDPTSGPVGGGTPVTLTGTGFVAGQTTVSIGTDTVAAGDVTVLSATSLSFLTPGDPAGLVQVAVTTPAGTSAPLGFTYQAPVVVAPTVTGIDPSSGPVAGGTQVTLTGTGFVAGGTSVAIGTDTVPATAVTFVSSTEVSFLTPGDPAGLVDVSVTTPSGTSVPVGFTYVAPVVPAGPTLADIDPDSGPAAGGTSVTLTGTGFVAGATSVTIGTDTVAAADVTFVSPTEVSFLTPGDPVGLVQVTVSTPDGTSGPAGFTYLAPPAPTVVTLAPSSGPDAGGTSVLVTGSGFVDGATSVTIGTDTVPAGDVTFVSPTQISFSTPGDPAGLVQVTVTTPNGTSAPAGFTYLAPVVVAPTVVGIDPVSGPAVGGTTVTLTGTGFVAGTTSVTIGTDTVPAAAVTFVSSTEVSFTTPGDPPGLVAVTVTTPAGTSGPVGFTYVAPVVPTVTAVSPTSGPVAGGTPVTLTGSGFVDGGTTVTIGTDTVLAADVTFVSPTEVSFTTPGDPAGLVQVTVTTVNGTSAPVGFTYVAPAAPSVTGIDPSSGPVVGGTPVTLTGTGFVDGATSVTIGTDTVLAADVTFVSPTEVSFTTPGDPAGLVDVTVTTGAGTSAPVGFTYVAPAAPTVTGIAPSSGPVAGGTPVTLTGTGFVAGGTSVTIGTDVVPATAVTFVSSTEVSFTTPGDPAGLVQVTATTPAGTSAPVGFTYVAPAVVAPTVTGIDPVSGPVAGGTQVTLTGTGFVAGGTSVTIGTDTVPAGDVTFVSATEVSFLTPGDPAGLVEVTVTTTAGTSAPVGFTYEAPVVPGAPTVADIDPVSGPVAGGTTVTLTGTGFVDGDTSVTIGTDTVPAEDVTFVSATEVSFLTPGDPAGLVEVTVTTPAGVSAPVGFTYLAPVVVAPTVTGIDPSSGPVAGGTTVTLTGTGFVDGGTSVTIGTDTVPAGDVTFVSATEVSFLAPGDPAGLVDVTVTTGAGTSVPVGFTYVAPAVPTVTGIAPSSGPVAGGTPVTLTGSGFLDGATTVTIGADTVLAGDVTFVSATEVSFLTPGDPAGLVDVTVTTGAGTSAPVGFTYLAPAVVAPTVTGIDPVSGPVAGGTPVTLTGTGFVDGGTSVTIGTDTVPAGDVTVVSATEISFSTPGDPAGLVQVTVTTPSGTSTPVGFTYVAPAVPTVTTITPASGPVAGGTPVTLTGTGFVAGATSVTIGTDTVLAEDVTVVSAAEISFLTPGDPAGLVEVRAVTAAGTSGAVGFTYQAPAVVAPTVTTITPTSGPAAGGTPVTLTGTGFVDGATSVTIGTDTVLAEDVTVVSATEISFSTPGDPAGLVEVTVTTPSGTSAPVGFSYLAPVVVAPTVTGIAPSSGPAAGGTPVTLTGTGFVDGATSVTIGTDVVPATAVTFVSATEISFSTPGDPAGLVEVTVTTPSGPSAPVGFSYLAPVVVAPTVTGIAPSSGPVAGGTPVTLTGTGFVDGATSVTIGTDVVPATAVTFVSATEISFSTPGDPAGLVEVTVTTPSGTSAPVGFSYLAPVVVAPTVIGIAPSSGPVAGGTPVTLTGTGFVDGATSVTIGTDTVLAEDVTVVSATEISFLTPGDPAGLVEVTVTTPSGTSGPVGFSYVAPALPTVGGITPASGPTAGGTPVTLTGTGFVAGTTVVIGGTTVPAADVEVVSDTELTFLTPPGTAGLAQVTVTTPTGTSAPVGFTYVAPVVVPVAPTATSLTPATGPLVGGTTVTVAGTGFVPGQTTVTVGGTPVPSTVLSPTELTLVTPPGLVPGTVEVVVTTVGGTTAPLGFTYLEPVVVPGAPTADSLTPATGPVGGGTTVTVTGTGFVPGQTTVTVGGVDVPVTVVSPTELTFVTPPGVAGLVDVVVTTPGGSATLGFTYLADAPGGPGTGVVGAGGPGSGTPVTGSGPRTGGGYLAYTGVDTLVPLVGGFLVLLVGTALVLVGRRRRTEG